jgi:GNAT superfamily N-acetyltransferase
MKVGDDDVVATLSLDTMVHPDFRGQGMFTKLAEDLYGRIANDGMPIVYGFPNAQSHGGFVKYLKWVDLVEPLPIFVRPLKFSHPIRSLDGNPR